MLKSFGKILKGGKKGNRSPNAEFDDLESVLKNAQGYRKRARGQRDESKGGKLYYNVIEVRHIFLGGPNPPFFLFLDSIPFD